MELSRRQEVVLLIGVFVLAAAFTSIGGALEWDEGSFLLNAEYFSGDDSNFEESRPAAISFLISLLWIFTGESTFIARVMVSVFGAGAVYLFYRLCNREFEEPLLPTAVFAFSPLMLYWSFRVYTDVIALFFVLGAVLSYRRKNYWLTGISLSLAATFRYLFLIFAVGFGIAMIIEKRKDFEELLRKVSEYAFGGIVGALPFLAYSTVRNGAPWSRAVMYVTRVSKWSDSGLFSATFLSLESAFLMLSGLIPPAIKGWWKTPAVDKSAVITYSVFMLSFSGNYFQRYWLAVLPFFILAAYRAVDRKWFVAASIVMIAVSGVAVADAAAKRECAQPLNQALDYVEGLEGDVVSDSWAFAGYRLDRKVHSTWTDYEKLNAEYDVKYAVVENEIPYEQLESFSTRCRTYRVYNLSEPSTPSS